MTDSGYNGAANKYIPLPHQLPPGSVLKERYRVERVIGEGGFGITYAGFDEMLKLGIAIKEYFPSDKAVRHVDASLDVSPHTGFAAAEYERGRATFLQEARAMAQLNKLPEIVGVRDYFEENNTAYIVMEYVEGTTFKELVAALGGRIEPKELFRMMEPLFPALEAMHKIGLIHRDISPENLMLENGCIRLLDFGCARESMQGTETLTISIKHGYAPIEQYQHRGQGPWTDVYGLSATIYYGLTGQVPAPALERVCEDELVPPKLLGIDLTDEQEKALLGGMEVRPKRRCQSVRELYEALYHSTPMAVCQPVSGDGNKQASVSLPDETEPAAQTLDSFVQRRSGKKRIGRRPAWGVPAAVAAIFLICVVGAGIAVDGEWTHTAGNWLADRRAGAGNGLLDGESESDSGRPGSVEADSSLPGNEEKGGTESLGSDSPVGIAVKYEDEWILLVHEGEIMTESFPPGVYYEKSTQTLSLTDASLEHMLVGSGKVKLLIKGENDITNTSPVWEAALDIGEQASVTVTGEGVLKIHKEGRDFGNEAVYTQDAASFIISGPDCVVRVTSNYDGEDWTTATAVGGTGYLAVENGATLYAYGSGWGIASQGWMHAAFYDCNVYTNSISFMTDALGEGGPQKGVCQMTVGEGAYVEVAPQEEARNGEIFQLLKGSRLSSEGGVLNIIR